MSMAWSDEQQRHLVALGYTLYRSAGASGTEVDLPDAAARIHAVPALKDRVTVVATDARDPLLLALLRAAHCDVVQASDTDGWLRAQQIPSLTQLRNNPAAKRALWPRLRALRRERVQR